MRSYITFVTSAAALVAGLVAVVVLHGGWDAAAVAVDVAAGFALVISLIAILAAAEHRPPRGPRPRAA